MSNAAAIILVLLGLIVVGAVVVVLFTGSDSSDLDLVPTGRNTGAESPDRPVVASINGKPDKQDSSKPKTEKIVLEDIKPRSTWAWRPVEVVVRVLSLPGLKALPTDEITFRVFLDDVPILSQPTPTGRAGEFSFGRLHPGLYRFEALTEDFKEGFLTLDVKPEMGYRNSLYVTAPAPFELKVVSAKSGHPIANAMIGASNLISRGLTDERGLFRSKRPIVPDPDLTVTVSKVGFFTTLFKPFSDEQVRERKKTRVIALKPLKGASRLAGTIVDQEGRPLNRWSLRLIPAGAKPSGPGVISFYETITNHKGAFTFKDLLAGDYILEGVVQNWVAGGANDYEPLFTESVRIEEAKIVDDLQIVCRLRAIELKGIVLRADTMEPVAGVTISTGGQQGNFLKDVLDFDDVVTDSGGRFSVEKPFLPTEIGTLLQRTGLRVRPRDGEEEVFRIQQGSQSMNTLINNLIRQVPITIWLHYAGRTELSGMVTDDQGTPVKGVIIEARPLFGFDRKRYRALSNANGQFNLKNLFTGRWNVNVTFPSGPSVHQLVTISPEGTPDHLKFKAPGSCSLKGRVDLTDTAYFPRISIRGENFRLDDTRLRKSGNFVFEHLPAGKATVVVESYTTQRFEEQSLVIRKTEVELLDRTTVSVDL